MNPVSVFLAKLVRTLFGLLTMALLGACVLSLLALGVCAALLSVLWSLLRGKKPAMVSVFQSFHQASRRFGPRSTSAPAAQQGDVVDVQAHEVRAGSE
jgi:hypothetical protein